MTELQRSGTKPVADVSDTLLKPWGSCVGSEMTLYPCTSVYHQRTCSCADLSDALRNTIDMFSVGDECLWTEG